MRYWEVEFSVKSLIGFPENVKIDTVSIHGNEAWDTCITEVLANTLQEAQNIGKRKVNELFQVLGFLYDSQYEISLSGCREIGPPDKPKQVVSYVPCSFTIMLLFDDKMHKNTIELLSSVKNANEPFQSALAYYNRGVQLDSWPSQAYLNYFQSIELIANTYIEIVKANKKEQKETKDKLHEYVSELRGYFDTNDISKVEKMAKKIYSLGYISTKSRIICALEDLGLECYLDKVNMIVNARHGIAHGDSQMRIISKEEFSSCKTIAKDVLMKYLER